MTGRGRARGRGGRGRGNQDGGPPRRNGGGDVSDLVDF